MAFWIFMLIMNLLIPFTMIGFGNYFKKQAPKEINMGFGYRTKMSMINKDTWRFAHNYCGRLWCVLGWILLIVSTVAMAVVIGKETNIIGIWGGIICGIQLVCLIVTIFPTEIALKKTFNENGSRRK